jgi:undecaprenyl diphosphate synthase
MMADVSPQAVANARQELGIPEDRIPRSVAIIMDGNGRWAEQRGLSRSEGHEQGAKVVRRIVTEAARLGLDALSLYSFSIENWRRPKEEVAALMHLYAEYFVQERQTIMDHNVRVRHLGRREGLPDHVLEKMDETLRLSEQNTGMYLCLALNYGSRAEIVDAVGRIAARAATGELDPADVDDEVLSGELDTAGVPDPDLVIRTSGELRLSNFLLWQVSYAEFYVTDAYWPDFDEKEFHEALRAYAYRHRRFGGLGTGNTPST